MTSLADIPEVQDIYKSGTPFISGTVGNLNDDQGKALRKLWKKVLDHFEAAADKPIKVTNDQIKQDAIQASGIDTDNREEVDKWYADNKDKVTDPKYQTVKDKLHIDGKAEPVVPGSFKPLFGDDLNTRTFRNTFWQASMLFNNPDSFLLAMLRASVWDIEAAFDRIISAVNWRASQAIDRLMWDGESVQNNRMMVNGLAIQAGKDRFGYQVNVVRIKLNVPKERGEGVVERFAAYSLEQLAMMAREHGERSILLYDFTGFGMENVDIAFIKTLLGMIELAYPQSLSASLLFVNSWLFSGIWKLIRPLIDPVAAKRTLIVKNIANLETFIEKDQILKEMGGGYDHPYEYVYPTREDNQKMFDKEGREQAEEAFAQATTEFEKITKEWISDKDKVSDESRLAAADKFKTTAAALDPYIRSRFITERKK